MILTISCRKTFSPSILPACKRDLRFDPGNSILMMKLYRDPYTLSKIGCSLYYKQQLITDHN